MLLKSVFDRECDLEDAILLSRLPDLESARDPSPPAQLPQPQKPRSSAFTTTRRFVLLAAITCYIGAAVGVYYVDDMEEFFLLLVWIIMLPVSSVLHSCFHLHSRFFLFWANLHVPIDDHHLSFRRFYPDT